MTFAQAIQTQCKIWKEIADEADPMPEMIRMLLKAAKRIETLEKKK